ncbi:MAG: Ras family protein [Chloroflexi bacterium ADurb.Bin360]|nr:MAG: Ras family protein [Chloroflexi bacterium ADurb.Bin360]
MAEQRVIQRKVCLLGAFAVGKTSLIRKYIEGCFDDKYLSTIGVKISRKSVHLEGGALSLILWDLAGSEEYNGVQTSYLQGATGGIIVCDLTRAETLDEWRRYTLRLRQVNPQARIILVANKADLVASRVLSDGDLRAAAAACASDGAIPPYLLTSAKTGENVEAAFLCLAQQLL